MSERFNNNLNTVSSKQRYVQSSVTRMENPTFTLIPPINSPTFISNIFANLWSYLDYYTLQDGLNREIPYTKGGNLDMLLNDIPTAFLSGGTIMFQIPSTEYTTQVSSSNFRIKIPLTGTTTATTLYSAYVNTPELFKQTTNENCGNSIVGDTLVSGDLQGILSKNGIGYSQSQGNSPQTNIEGNTVTNAVALFSNDWEFSGTTTGLTSWSYGYGTPANSQSNRRIINGGRTAYAYPTPNLGVSGTSFSDRAAGIFFSINGIGLLFGDFVTNFDWGSATGGTGTTEVTFPISHAAVEACDVDFETMLNISMILPEDSYNSSQNKSWMEAVNYSGEICGVLPIEICFENSNRVPLMIAQFDPTDLQIKTEEKTFVLEFDAVIGSQINLGTPNPYPSGVFDCVPGTCPKYI